MTELDQGYTGWPAGDQAEQEVNTAEARHDEVAQEVKDELKDVDKGGKQGHFSFMDQIQAMANTVHHAHFQLYTEAELAGAFGVQPLTLGKWRRDGGGPAYVQVGKRVFYRHKNVNEWLEANTRKFEEPQQETQPSSAA